MALVRAIPVFPEASARERALGEIHSRPVALVESARAIYQLAFLTDADRATDLAAIEALSQLYGAEFPRDDSSHHAIRWTRGTLRWERHTEFSTYFWDGPAPDEFGGTVDGQPFDERVAAPGLLISGVMLEIRDEVPANLEAHFDPTSLCRSDLQSGHATILTDFRQDPDGLTKILVIDRGLTASARGALVQRLFDIETYRTLAMMALPLAQGLSPEIRGIEARLTTVTERMKTHARDEADRLLGEITLMAAELEANAALCLYRFGASRAYYEIVQQRIRALGEIGSPGSETLGTFLEKRLAPAMRTCRSVEERQANLSRKLARATALLRSWIDIEMERINTSLLNSMNRRAYLQLRLQQTVEGLSVAAITYYVVGLLGYIMKGFKELGLPVTPEAATGAAVPMAAIVIWLIVRRIRHSHAPEHSEA